MIKRLAVNINYESYFLEGYNNNEKVEYYMKGNVLDIIKDNQTYFNLYRFIIYLNFENKSENSSSYNVINKLNIVKTYETNYSKNEMNVLSFLKQNNVTSPVVYFDLNNELNGGVFVNGKKVTGVNNMSGNFSNIIISQSAKTGESFKPLTIKETINQSYLTSNIEIYKQFFPTILNNKTNYDELLESYRKNDYIAIKLFDRIIDYFTSVVETITHIIDPEYLIFVKTSSQNDNLINSKLKEALEKENKKVVLMNNSYGLGGLIINE